MKHSQYEQLIQALDNLAGNADILRAVFDVHRVDIPAGERIPGGPATRMVPTDQARQHSDFRVRNLLWRGASNLVDDVSYKMKQLVDGFVEENQARADQGLGITTDGRALFDAMSRFMSATETPIPGAHNLYDYNHVVTVKTEHDGGVFSRDVFVRGVRTQCRDWMDRIVAWFPGLNPGMTPDQAGTPRPADGPDLNKGKEATPDTIDKERLGALFIVPFRNPKPRPGMAPLPAGFELFYNALASGHFNPTEIGRIAYQVKQSDKVLPMYKKKSFAEFARLFFNACGVTTPKDLAPNKYREPGKANFSTWL